MLIWIVAFLAFFIGFSMAYLWRASKIAELNSLLKSREKINDEFKLAASDAVQGAARQVVTEALKDFRQVKTETDFSVSDMKSRLEDYQKIVKKFEQERFEMYGNLKNSIDQVLNVSQSVRLETAALKKALGSSVSAQGNLGQILLEQILEQNGLIKGIGYDTQVSLENDAGSTLRPDFVIHLPGNKKLIVDSKAPVGEFMQAMETEDPERQREHYRKLAGHLRENVARLSKKDYQHLMDSDIRFVLMFVPEGPIRAALSVDPLLFQDAQAKNVMLTSPMTIIPLIQLIAYSWQQYRLANNAKELGAEVEVLGQRLSAFMEHLGDVRQGLKKTQEGWNKAAGSWQLRLSPQLEKIKNLGGKLKEVQEPEFLPQELSDSPLQKNSNLLE